MSEGESPSKPPLGFIGLGHMGSRMAKRLLAAGYPLTVYNRTANRTRTLVRAGAKEAPTPAAVAAVSDVLLISLADDAAVRRVLLGADAALVGMRSGSVLIDLSTVSPKTSREIFTVATAKGIAMIDAPVSGSLPQAEEGTLMIYVGGAEATYRRCQPILAVLGQECHYMGHSGMGTTMKLVVNALLGVGVQVLGEALALGEKGGLDKDRMIDVLSQTTVVSPAQKGNLANARQGKYPVNFALSLMHKDFGLVLRHATDLAVPMPATAAAQQMCAGIRAKDREEDFSAIIRYMAELAGLPHSLPIPQP